MAYRHLLFRTEARDKLLRGANALADAIRLTIGPKAQCVLIQKKWDKPIVCDDGVTIAKEFELKDAEENLGAQVIREAAEKTGDAVGDGTSTATIPEQFSLLRGLVSAVEEGVCYVVGGDVEQGALGGLNDLSPIARSQAANQLFDF